MTVLQDSETLKKTPLYDRHLALHGKIVNFGGWALPIQYTSILEEHKHVRSACGAFDVSHLGEVRVKGEGAFKFLQARLTNDLTKLSDGRMLYSLLCDELGRTIDDILIYRSSAEDYYLIVNASRIAADMEAFKKYAPDSLEIVDHSDEMACIAVQGPKSEEALKALFGWDLSALPYYAFTEAKAFGSPVWVSRSGYTGEDGFEIFSANAQAGPLWDKIVGEGAALGVKPCGLGARNTLRLEAGNALYGNDIDETTTPMEAGLQFAVALGKPGGFVGRDRLMAQKEGGISRKLVAFRMLDKPIAREHYPIFRDGRKIGVVTSGSFGPTVGCGIGLGYVQKGCDEPGTKLEIEVHGSRAAAEVVKRPFVPLNHKRGA